VQEILAKAGISFQSHQTSSFQSLFPRGRQRSLLLLHFKVFSGSVTNHKYGEMGNCLHNEHGS